MDDNRGYVNWQSLRAYVLDRFFLCLQVDDSEDDEMMGVDEAASQEGDTDEDELHDEYETVRYYIFPVTSQQTAQQTQNICITFVQRWSTTLYKCHTDVLCLLGDNVMSILFQCSATFLPSVQQYIDNESYVMLSVVGTDFKSWSRIISRGHECIYFIHNTEVIGRGTELPLSCSKHETLSQCWYNVGPPSSTLAQHCSNIG